ncbi:MAG TPA: L,D-transpeptidase family protein [Chitinophagaceae bacterium]|nr:L,D-transpeptidase family protein [Chitinophagaceae bacterium]
MKPRFLLWLALTVIFYDCSQGNNGVKAQKIIKRDTSINASTSYSEIFFDSTKMEQFLSSQDFHDSLVKRIRNFYNARNYQFAWFFKEGMADYATSFYEIYNDYISYSKDSTFKSYALQKLYDSLINGNFSYNVNDSIVFNSELLLTAQFFRYTRRAYQGNNQLDARELEWFIPRKKIDPSALLDSVLVRKGKSLADLEPVNRQYNLLKDYLLKYYEIENKGSWSLIKADKKSYKLNDSSPSLSAVKKRLLLTGDLSKEDTTATFTKELEEAVKNFERRYGLKEDGIITATLLNEMNRPIRERIEQILLNMERIRWVPAEPTTDYLLVNIPAFRLHVYDKGKYAWSTNVVVGTAANNTVIFTGNLKYIVFSPYWNVPSSILRKEILPAIARNKNYLARHHMEWNGNSVRQKPGPWNSLGLVKFLFPNNYSIYLHDTPSKSLFNEERRTFSHGCIRVNEPKKLAEFLLRNDSNWDSVKISKAMNAGKEQFYNMKDPVPVFIGYFTAWVDRDGNLNFREDVYGHDKKMKERLFAKTQ